MSNYTLRLRRKTKYSPEVEGVKLPSEGCAGAFKTAGLFLSDPTSDVRHPKLDNAS